MRSRVGFLAAAVAATLLLAAGTASGIEVQYSGSVEYGAGRAEGWAGPRLVLGGFLCPGADGATATVDWGDGTGLDSTTPVVTYDSAAGTCSITGTHRYAEEGSFQLTVVYRAASGATTSTTYRMDVLDNPIVVTAVPTLEATAGQPFAGVVGSLSDPGGDPYAAPGDHQVQVRVDDDGGAVDTAVGAAHVSSPPSADPAGRLLVVLHQSIDPDGVIHVSLARRAKLTAAVYSLPSNRYLGTLAFGSTPRGHSVLRWGRRLHGRPLAPGRYAIRLRAQVGQTTVVSGRTLRFALRRPRS